MIPEYRIRRNYGHYEAVDSFGRFVCSGDTFDEVENDIITMIKEMVGGMKLENSHTRARTSTANAS